MSAGQAGVRRHAHIDLAAVLENLRAASASPSDLTADLRADAYGHGLIPVARALSDAGVGGFVVSRVEDAAALADAGIRPATVVSTAADAPRTGSGSRTIGPRLLGLDPAHPGRPALRLTAEVIAVKHVGADRGVSYGYTYRTRKPTTLALVALGFADGVPRVASNKAPVRVADVIGRVSGRIAMDQFVVDLDGGQASPGDVVVLFGDPARGEPSVLDWADAIGIAAPVITTRLGRRIERVYSA
jgi:alanine racemase